MIYSLPLLSFWLRLITQVDIYFRCYWIECQRCCCSSPRPNWRSPGPPQPGSPCYLCSKFLHKIVIGPRDPNKTINTQLVTRLTLASSPHSLLALSMSMDSWHMLMFVSHPLILDFWRARSEEGCSENDGISVTPIRMPVSKLTTVNINQVLASSPITRMAFLQDLLAMCSALWFWEAHQHSTGPSIIVINSSPFMQPEYEINPDTWVIKWPLPALTVALLDCVTN